MAFLDSTRAVVEGELVLIHRMLDEADPLADRLLRSRRLSQVELNLVQADIRMIEASERFAQALLEALDELNLLPLSGVTAWWSRHKLRGGVRRLAHARATSETALSDLRRLAP